MHSMQVFVQVQALDTNQQHAGMTAGSAGGLDQKSPCTFLKKYGLFASAWSFTGVGYTTPLLLLHCMAYHTWD